MDGGYQAENEDGPHADSRRRAETEQGEADAPGQNAPPRGGEERQEEKAPSSRRGGEGEGDPRFEISPEGQSGVDLIGEQQRNGEIGRVPPPAGRGGISAQEGRGPQPPEEQLGRPV